MDFIKRPIFWGLLLVAFAITLVWTYLSQENKEEASNNQTPQVINLSNVDPTDFDTILTDELNLAVKKASEESSERRLAAIEVEIPKDLKPNTGTTRYVFSNDQDKGHNWTITFSQSSGNYIRALIPASDYLGELNSMDTKLWKFNYITALQLAEKNGGLEWRESNELSGIKLTLRHTPPKNWLVWTIQYTGQGTNFTKVIDANSGQILE